MSMLDIQGLTTIPPEVMEVFREKCELKTLTYGCLKKQLEIDLKLPDLEEHFLIRVNSILIKKLSFKIKETDLVQILPLIAGG